MIDYLEELKKLIAKQYDIDEEMIEENSFLEADLNMTDLDMEDFVEILEDKYQIEIPQNVYSNFKTVSDMANYLYENAEQA